MTCGRKRRSGWSEYLCLPMGDIGSFISCWIWIKQWVRRTEL